MKIAPFALSYLLVIFLTNLGFSYVHPIDIGFGLFSPMALIAGAVFVARDYAQREVGSHKVILFMFGGALISYLMADPYVAVASLLAFAMSELADWLFYTFTKLQFHKRVLVSSIVSTPVDTVVFLAFINILTPATFVLMVASKLVVAVVIYYLYESGKIKYSTK